MNLAWLTPARSNLLKLVLLCFISALLLSCEAVGYYSQAARGQLGILLAREDIESLLAGDEIDANLRSKLELVMAAREFATAELLLPGGDSYRSYVDLDREHAVWNVFAAPEFSIEPLSWCYPIAGCVAYRGYFSEQAARRYADRLSADGYDVYLGAVDAYSTLGWFDDPLFSTVINRPDAQLAALIFHELAHQLIYVPGDTTFNESFATVVEREGARRWLQARGSTDSSFLQRNDYREEFVALVLDYRDRLASLYGEDLNPESMRLRKGELQQQLRNAYGDLKGEWSGYRGYDNWFAGPLNNAQLTTVASYNDLVPSFQALLQEAGGDLQVFYASVRSLAEMDPEERNASLGVNVPGDGG